MDSIKKQYENSVVIPTLTKIYGDDCQIKIEYDLTDSVVAKVTKGKNTINITEANIDVMFERLSNNIPTERIRQEFKEFAVLVVQHEQIKDRPKKQGFDISTLSASDVEELRIKLFGVQPKTQQKPISPMGKVGDTAEVDMNDISDPDDEFALPDVETGNAAIDNTIMLKQLGVPNLRQGVDK